MMEISSDLVKCNGHCYKPYIFLKRIYIYFPEILLFDLVLFEIESCFTAVCIALAANTKLFVLTLIAFIIIYIDPKIFIVIKINVNVHKFG